MASDKKARREKNSCLFVGDKPVFYTSSISSDRHNLLTIITERLTLTYALTGWLEVFLKTRSGKGERDKIEIRLQLLNIKGILVGNQCDATVPRKIHLSASTDSKTLGSVYKKNGSGRIRIPVKVSYPELAGDAGQRRPGQRHYQPPPVPLSANLDLALQLDLERGGFVSWGHMDLPKFSPLAFSNLAPCILFFSCICDSKPHCLEMCLSIKVATRANGAMVYSEQQVRDMIDAVNAIWGCQVAGQCCIKFSIKNISSLVFPRFTSVGEPSDSTMPADFANLIKTNRDPDCYDLYLIDSFTGPDPSLGDTHLERGLFSDSSASVVTVNQPTAADVSHTAAHELGHALGLDDVGSPPTNLMAKHNAVSNRLSSGQCQLARSSGYLKKLDPECTLAPRG